MLLIDFINVGYGDAILVREMDGPLTSFAMLVDCGDWDIPIPPGSCRISAADFLTAEGVEKLDLLVLTHLHLDHCGGLEALVEQIPIQKFWSNYLPPSEAWGIALRETQLLSSGASCLCRAYNIFSRSLQLLHQRGTSIEQVNESGPAVSFGSGQLLCERFSEPPELHNQQSAIWNVALEQGAMDEPLTQLDGFINNTSIRMRLEYKGFSMELPGDTYANCWQRHSIPKCNILKLPHHGHRDSLTKDLLDMLCPDYAVISVSNDRPDPCPHPSIVEMLRDGSRQVLFTDNVSIDGLTSRPQHSVRFTVRDNKLKCQSYLLNKRAAVK